MVGVESIELPIWGFTDPSSPKNYSHVRMTEDPTPTQFPET
jgi:hypothetical protein